MEKEKNSFVVRIKEHQIELIITGVSIAAITTVIAGIKNHKVLEGAWAYRRKLIEKTPEAVPVVKPIQMLDVISKKV